MVASLDWVRLGLRAARTLGEVGRVGYGDVWVELEGCGRWEAFRAVEAACRAEDRLAEALPTTGGVLVRLYRPEEDDPDAWPGRVAALAQRLSLGGRGVHITIPPVSTQTPRWAGAPPFVSACLAWPADPPPGEGSYRFGRHPEGWQLAPSTTRMVIDEAVDWVLGGDGVGGINEHRPVPVTAR